MPSSPYNAIFEKKTSSKQLKVTNPKMTLPKQKAAPGVPRSAADTGLVFRHWLASFSISFQDALSIGSEVFSFIYISLCVFVLDSWWSECMNLLVTILCIKAYFMLAHRQYYFSILAPVIKLVPLLYLKISHCINNFIQQLWSSVPSVI